MYEAEKGETPQGFAKFHKVNLYHPAGAQQKN
jgi:hypothetical protein